MDDEVRIAELRQKFSRHGLKLQFFPARDVAMVDAEDDWIARILHERGGMSAGIDGAGFSRREAAEREHQKFDLLHSEQRSLASQEEDRSDEDVSTSAD